MRKSHLAFTIQLMIVENNREAETSPACWNSSVVFCAVFYAFAYLIIKKKSLLLRASSCILLPRRSVEATRLGSMLPLLQFPLSRYAVAFRFALGFLVPVNVLLITVLHTEKFSRITFLILASRYILFFSFAQTRTIPLVFLRREDYNHCCEYDEKIF